MIFIPWLPPRKKKPMSFTHVPVFKVKAIAKNLLQAIEKDRNEQRHNIIVARQKQRSWWERFWGYPELTYEQARELVRVEDAFRWSSFWQARREVCQSAAAV